MTVNFVALMAPTNEQVFDPGSYYNAALAIVVGLGAGAATIAMLPGVPADMRARRLLALTLHDLRRLAAGQGTQDIEAWQSTVYGRLGSMPPTASQLQLARLMAAFWVGAEVMRLRRLAGGEQAVGEAFALLAAGDSQAAAAALARAREGEAGAGVSLRVRASALGLRDALARHNGYFDAPAEGPAHAV